MNYKYSKGNTCGYCSEDYHLRWWWTAKQVASFVRGFDLGRRARIKRIEESRRTDDLAKRAIKALLKFEEIIDRLEKEE